MSDSHIDVNDGGSHCQVLVFEFVAERAAKTKIADLLIAKIFSLNLENSFFCHTLLSEVVLLSLPFWIG